MPILAQVEVKVRKRLRSKTLGSGEVRMPANARHLLLWHTVTVSRNILL